MDITSTFVEVILVLICSVPFIILNQQSKKSKKNRLKSLNSEAKKLQCKIDTHEFCGDYLIGIDTEKSVLFFNKKLKEKTEDNSVSLSQVKECNICTEYQDIKTKGQSFKEVEQLYLSFIPLIKNQPEIKLIFFDADINMMLSGELESIKKWLNITNTQLALKV